LSTFTKSNEEAILDAITGELAAAGVKVKCELGEAEDVRRGAPPRIAWVPSRRGRRYTHPAQQRAGMKVGHEKNVLFDVHVWGANYTEASRLEEALIGVLFNRLSPNAYELGDGAGPPDEPETPNEAGKGYELVIPIRLLRIPIAAEWRTSLPVESLTATGEVEGHGGAEPASPAPTITISG
jgi:hypothetical protein